VEPERLLPRRGRVLLLRVRDRDLRVEIDGQFPGQVRAGSRRPGPVPRGGPGPGQGGQVSGVDPFQKPPRGGVGRDRPEQTRPMGQGLDPANAVRPIRERNREIGEHLTRCVRPRTAVGVRERDGHRLDQTGLGAKFPPQLTPRLRHDPPAVPAHGPPSSTLHPRGAFPCVPT
jgi:hypothetical protein